MLILYLPKHTVVLQANTIKLGRQRPFGTSAALDSLQYQVSKKAQSRRLEADHEMSPGNTSDREHAAQICSTSIASDRTNNLHSKSRLANGALSLGQVVSGLDPIDRELQKAPKLCSWVETSAVSMRTSCRALLS